MATTKEPREQREIDRDEELERQKKVTDALDKFNKENRAEAEKALEDQRKFETTGIRTVEGKP